MNDDDSRRAPRRDTAVLVLLVIASFLPYVARLGFHVDDWSFVGRLANAPSRSLGSLYGSIIESDPSRPLTHLYVAALYRLFGARPAGAHLVVMLLLAAAAALLASTLRRAGASRGEALALALLWAALPHDSTNRFWVAGSQAIVASLFFFLAFYCEVRAEQGAAAWKLGALSSAFVGALAYEAMVPFLLVTPVLILTGRLARPRATPPLRRLISAALSLAVVASIALFKLRTLNPDRRPGRGLAPALRENLRLALSGDFPRDAGGFNLWRALSIHFGDYLLLLPKTVWTLGKDASALEVAIAAALGVAAFWYLRRLPPPPLDARRSAAVIGAGLGSYLLGFGVFLGSRAIQLTPTGMSNRSAVAAAVGVAAVLVGIVGAASALVRRRRADVFGFGIAGLSFAFVVILMGLASHWVEAAREQRRVLSRVASVLPDWPGGTLLLDGVCPYDGPATVFENHWELSGALQALYRRSEITADVLTRASVAGRRSLFTSLGGGVSYPYGPELRVLSLEDGRTTSLVDAESARRVLAASAGRISACADGAPGIGVDLLAAPPRARGEMRLLELIPPRTEAGVAFNTQPDGGSALAAVCANAPPGAVLVFDGEPLPTARSADGRTVSAVVPRALVEAPGPRRVHLQRFVDTSNELLFEVSAPPAAGPLGVSAISPPAVRAGEPFHPQPDGSSALSVTCSGATRSTRIVLDGQELATTFGSGTWLTALVPRAATARPGSHRVWLVDGARRSNVVELAVTP